MSSVLYWTAARLQQHLRASRFDQDGCYPRLTRWMATTQTRRVIEKPQEFQMVHRLPTCCSAGPPHPGSEISQGEADRGWQRAWDDSGFPGEVDLEVARQVRQIAQMYVGNIPADEGELNLADLLIDLEQCDFHSDSHHHAYLAFCRWCNFEFCHSHAPQLSPARFDQIHLQVWQLIHDLDIGQMLLWRWRMDEAYRPTLVIQLHYQCSIVWRDLVRSSTTA